MKFKSLFFLALVVLLSSCEDDPLSERIIGTWNLTSIERTGCDDPDENIALTTVDDNGCLEAEGDIVCNVFILFSADNTASLTYTVDNDTDVDPYTYTVNDENETVSFCEDTTDCTTLNVDGDVMTQTITGEGCIQVLKYKKS